jgi:CRP/FNR family transcriptional regulator, cyclic AMP receptor protein
MLSQVLPAVRTDRHPLSYVPERSSSAHSPYGLPVVDNCVSTALRKSHSSVALSKSSLEELDRIKHATTYPEGALIFVEGQAPRGVYVLCQGRAKLMATNSEGKTFILKIAQPGEILGLHSVVTGLAHELTVETLQPAQMAFIAREDFLRFLKEHADACLYVAQQISNDCQSAYEVIRSIGLSHSVSEKLARVVLQWSADGQTVDRTIRMKVALTHEEIAQLIGTTRESVTRILSQFKKQRIMELHGSTLTLFNKAALERLLVC